jgi:hypothetical protein
MRREADEMRHAPHVKAVEFRVFGELWVKED